MGCGWTYPGGVLTLGRDLQQESEGGESEYDDEAGEEMEVDELQSEGEKVSVRTF